MVLSEADRGRSPRSKAGCRWYPALPRHWRVDRDRRGRGDRGPATRSGARGVIRRFGLVVRHRGLGYRANAMTVWDARRAGSDAAARHDRGLPFVTWCYRRPRRPPTWPYNLFCMIHGKDRPGRGRGRGSDPARRARTGLPRAVLFSRRRQNSAAPRHATRQPAAEEAMDEIERRPRERAAGRLPDRRAPHAEVASSSASMRTEVIERLSHARRRRAVALRADVRHRAPGRGR